MQKYAPYIIGLGLVGMIIAVIIKTTGSDAKTPITNPAPTATPATDPTVMQPPPVVSSVAPIPDPVPGPTSVAMATAAYEAKMVSRAQAALDKGDPKLALREIEEYERIPDRALLTPEATVIKIQALASSKVGRRTDALALAMETRDDEKFKPYHEKIELIIEDAGLVGPTPTPKAP